MKHQQNSKGQKGANFLKAMKKRETFQTIKKPFKYNILLRL